MAIGEAEIANRFGFHIGTSTTIPLHHLIRADFEELAVKLDKILPDGRAKSTAFTKLEEAAMWANKAVAEDAPLEGA